ncbi:MAG: ABC transporter permease [Rhizobiaceae bacterium]|nr:ABC transporter permease [Rhizobiaceae bacterium]
MMDLAASLLSPEFFAAILRVSTPIILVAMGVLISERAGVVNIGAEGMMLSGAFCGVVFSAYTGSATVGLVAAIVAGMVGGLFMSFAVHVLRANLFLSGIALNLAASAGTILALFALTGEKGISGTLDSEVLPSVHIPWIQDLPVLGTILSGHHILTYVAFLSVPAVAIFMMRTPTGLRMRAVGENPEAAKATGLSVIRLQLQAFLLCGVFAGAGGAFLSMGYVSWFSQNMTAGRGFIALAAEVMGAGGAYGTLAASLLLGSVDVLAIALAGEGLPSELLQAAPYVVTVLALALYGLRQAKQKTIGTVH